MFQRSHYHSALWALGFEHPSLNFNYFNSSQYPYTGPVPSGLSIRVKASRANLNQVKAQAWLSAQWLKLKLIFRSQTRVQLILSSPDQAFCSNSIENELSFTYIFCTGTNQSRVELGPSWSKSQAIHRAKLNMPWSSASKNLTQDIMESPSCPPIESNDPSSSVTLS